VFEPSAPSSEPEYIRISVDISASDLLAELKAAVDAGKARDALIIAGILLGSLESCDPQDALSS